MLLFTGNRLRVAGYRFRVTRNRWIKISLIFFCFLLVDPLFAQEFFTDLEDTLFSKQWINLRILDSVEGHSGSHFSIADAKSPYGLGIETRFPEEAQGQNTMMIVDGWVKSSAENDQALFVITFQEEGVTVFWTAVSLQHLLNEKNKWTNFSKAVKIPASVTKNGILKAFLWNDDRKDTIAIDDLSFSFELLPNPTFLPEIYTPAEKAVFAAGRVVMENDFYKIRYDEKEQKITFSASSGRLLIHELMYFEESETHKISVSNFKLDKVSKKKSGKVLHFSVGNGNQNLEMEMLCRNDSRIVPYSGNN